MWVVTETVWTFRRRANSLAVVRIRTPDRPSGSIVTAYSEYLVRKEMSKLQRKVELKSKGHGLSQPADNLIVRDIGII